MTSNRLKPLTLSLKCAFLFLIALIVAGCGGGGGGTASAPTGSQPTGSGSNLVGTIVVNQVLLRALPRVVTQTRFTGFDAQGVRRYGPVTVAKAPNIRLTDVPVAVTRLQIEQLADNVVVGLGTVAVTVSAGQTTTITDPPYDDVQVVLSTLQLSPPNPQTARGLSVQLAAMGTFTDGSQLDQTTSVSWTSSNSSVAQVDAGGAVRGVNAGTSVITASLGPVSAQVTVTVTSAVVTSITVTPKDSAIPGGVTQQFTAIAQLSDSTTQDVTRSASWASTSTNIASISTEGLVTTKEVGRTTISATQNSVVGSTSLDVTVAITGLRVDPPVVLYAPGETREFRVYADFADNTEVDVTDQCELSVSTAHAAITSPQQSGDPTKITLDPSTPLASTVTFTASLYSLEATAEIRVNRLVFTSLIFDARVLSLQSSADGVLTQVDEVATDDGPGGLAVSRNGIYLYVSNFNTANGVATYEIAADGRLTFLSKLQGKGCDKLVVHPSGKYMYGGTRGSSLEAYTLKADGSVELLESEPAGAKAYNVALSPDGHYLYSADIDSSLLWTHRVEEDGTLTLVDSQSTPVANPYDVSVSTDGTTLVVTLAVDTSVATYDLTMGETPQLIQRFDTFEGLQSLVFDPQGRYAVGAGNFFTSYAVAPLDFTHTLGSTEWGPTPSGPWQTALNSTGDLFFMTSPGNTKVGSAKVAADGTLSGLSVFDTSGGTGDGLLQPRGLAVTP